MNESQLYSALQDAKYSLARALEQIKEYDFKLGSDSKESTFRGEVKDIIEEAFPNFEDYD